MKFIIFSKNLIYIEQLNSIGTFIYNISSVEQTSGDVAKLLGKSY